MDSWRNLSDSDFELLQKVIKSLNDIMDIELAMDKKGLLFGNINLGLTLHNRADYGTIGPRKVLRLTKKKC